jgi:hypothetical protein
MSTRRVLILTSLLAAALLAACGASSTTSTSNQAPAAPTTSTSSQAPAASTTSTSNQAPAAPTTSSTATATATTAAATAKSPLGPEGIPLEQGPDLAPAATTSQGATVDGVQCAPVEQLAYHIHAHLQVYFNGHPRALPAAIGMVGPVAEQTPYGPFYGAQQCYYWLHTHTSDGIIHMESPSVRIYTLGNFFDEWNQPLSRTQVAGGKGKVTAFVNDKRWTRDPRAIPLLPHVSIQLDVGSPVVPPYEVSFAGTSL